MVGRPLALAGGLALCLVSFLGSLVADEPEDAAYDVGDDELTGLGGDEAAACARDIGDEPVYVMPFRARDDLEEDVGGRDGAGLGALDLPPLQQAVRASDGVLAWV